MVEMNRYSTLKQQPVSAPFISVIIPTHNRKEELLAALASVSAQTHPNLEIIVVDDGSTDGTFQVVQDYQANKEPRLRFINQQNLGVSTARNRGVAEARGEIIAFLDDDDTWAPEKLAVQWGKMAKNPGGDWLCLTDVYIKKPGGSIVKTRGYSDDVFDPDHPLKLDRFVSEKVLILPSTWMMPKRTFERVGGFDPQMLSSEDGEFLVRVLRAGGQLRIVNQHLSTYKGPGPNKSRPKHVEGFNRFIHKHHAWLKENSLPLAAELMRRAEEVYRQYGQPDGALPVRNRSPARIHLARSDCKS